MRVMLIDGGARGHALALAYLRDSNVRKVLVAPGNDGMRFNQIYGFAKRENILTNTTINLKKPETVPAAAPTLAQQCKPDIIEVAQNDALAAGTVDTLQKAGFRVFGPTHATSQIEWDKAYTRKFWYRNYKAPQEITGVSLFFVNVIFLFPKEKAISIIVVWTIALLIANVFCNCPLENCV